MFDMLKQVLSNPQTQSSLTDFVTRYNQGPPHEGYTNQETANAYNQVAPNLSPDQYQAAAQQAFTNMSPEQRQQFGVWLQQQAQARGVTVSGGAGGAQQYADPGALAGMAAQMHQQQPDLLGQLLGSSGEALQNPFVKAAVAGVAAMAVQRMLGQNR
ncbi:MAG TPA: hypothetical protein VII06_40590 [Chloroflexota bacterium]|jgi:hypothetical protein